MVKMQSSRQSCPVFHFRQIVNRGYRRVNAGKQFGITSSSSSDRPFWLHTLHADVLLADQVSIILTTSTDCGTESLEEEKQNKKKLHVAKIKVSNFAFDKYCTAWPWLHFSGFRSNRAECTCRQSSKLDFWWGGGQFSQQLKLCNQTHTHTQ